MGELKHFIFLNPPHKMSLQISQKRCPEKTQNPLCKCQTLTHTHTQYELFIKLGLSEV